MGTLPNTTRRPPANRINALVSFGNSLMYVTALSEIHRTHLDPRIGFLHTTNRGRYILNLDVAEIFKPLIVDRAIFSLANRGAVKAKDFRGGSETEGVFLTEKGRKSFIEAYESRPKEIVQHPRLGRAVSYRRLIRLEVYKLEKHLLGDEPYERTSRGGSSAVFVLMVYDVDVKRVTKVVKIGRKYLNQIQNSVLEGDLSPAQYKQLKHEVTKTINPDHDSVRFYLLRTAQYMTVDKLGFASRPGDAGAFL